MVDQMDEFALDDTLARAKRCFAASGCEVVHLGEDILEQRALDMRELIDQTVEQVAGL